MFFHAKELTRPEDVRPYLADPEKHWRPAYSAFELATSWIGSGGIPGSVRAVLDSCETFRDCVLVEGFFEHQVDLRTSGRASQADLLALVQLRKGYGVIAVEGKAREAFGPIVQEWNDGPGKERRLQSLCQALALDSGGAGLLRYQLLHRTVSALYEAERYGASEAMMLVHSFGEIGPSFDDYRAFAASLDFADVVSNGVSAGRATGQITLRLAWVQAG